MKKLTLAILALFFVGATLNAQELGLRLGANLATQSWDTEDNEVEPDNRFGIYAGVITKFGLGDLLKLRTELNYAQYGYEASEDGFDRSARINHLDIPILVELNISVGEALAIYANAGPQICYALNGSYQDGDEEVDIDFDEEEYSRFDFGLAFGGGVGFGVGDSGMLALELRYFLGLNNLYTGDDDGDFKALNRGFQVGLAYMF